MATVATLAVSLKADIDSFEKGMAKAAKTVDKWARQTKALSIAAGGVLAGLGGAVKMAVDYESAFAGVRKTVDATETEFAQLSQGLRDMSKTMPQSASDLARITELAGQLGIKNENLLTFTRTIADLAESTNLSAEAGASMLAQFANITGMDQSQFSNLGSTIVELGNNFATTEADIVEMAQRLAGAGTVAGLTEPEIMGMATALSSVGIEAEAGGSAFSKLMVAIASQVETGGEKLAQFASVAGMSSDQFSQSFKDKPAEAIIAFVEGLGKMQDSGDGLFTTLENLGITEVRMRDALLRSSSAGDLLSAAINTANEAFTENNALQDEAAKRYATTESQLKIAKNTLVDIAITIGEAFLPALNDMLENLKPVIDKVSEWVTKHKDFIAEKGPMIVAITAIVAALTPFLLTISAIITALSGPVGLVIVVATAAAAIGTALNNMIDKYITPLANAIDWLFDKALAARNMMLSLFGMSGPSGDDFLGSATSAAMQRNPGAFEFSSGGIVPGYGNSDTVPAMLTPGELVIPKERVESFGTVNATITINGAQDPERIKRVVIDALEDIQRRRWTGGARYAMP